MSFAEVLDASRELTNQEKVRLIEKLTADLKDAPESNLLDPGCSYPVWSPIDSFEAAATMMRLLEEEKA